MVSTRGSRYKFSEGERVLCYEPDPTKAKVLYDSKVLEVTEGKDKRGRRCVEYLIHFQGWNSSWDRAVSEDFVLKDTEENRQLQRDLAEQSQLQIGAYLYRRERKKRSGGSACTTGGSSTGDSSSGAKRARHADDDVSSGDSTPLHHQGDRETGEPVDTDSSSSSQQSVAGPPLVRPIAPPPMIQTNGRTAIVLPTGVRERLTYDYHLVVKRGRLSYLPASPNVCTILESCVREYARIGVWRSPKQAARRGRMSPMQDVRPDINDVSRRLNLMREVAEGLRVYFDYLLNRHLLYRQETEQYHTLVGCFIEKSTAKEEELLQTMAANIVAASEASSCNTRDSSQSPGAVHADGTPDTNNTTITHSNQPSTSAGLRPHYRVAPKQQLRSKFVRLIPVMRITRQQTDNNNTYAADHRSTAVRFKIERPLDGGKPTSVRYKLRSPKRDRPVEDPNVRTGRSESSIVQQMNNQVHYWANGIGEGAEIVENWIERGKPETDEDENGETAKSENFVHNYVRKENAVGKLGDRAAQEDSLGEWVNGDEGESQYGTTGTDVEEEESGSEETETEEDNEEGLDLTVNALDQDEVELVDSDEDWGAGVDIEAEEEGKSIEMEAKIEAQEGGKQKNGEKTQDLNIRKHEEPDTRYIKKEKNNVKAEPSDKTGDEKDSIEIVKGALEVEKDFEIKHRALSPRIKVSGGKDMDKVLKEAAPGTSAGVLDSLARRLRSHKSSVNSTEPCDEKPSTSTGILNSETPLLKGSSMDSTCSSERCGTSGQPWARGGPHLEPAVTRGLSGPEPAVTHGGPMDPTLARGPVAKLLEKISGWELLPSVGHEHVPSKVYGAVHLSRLFVRLPDFLNAINIPEAKLKLLLGYISMFVHYLEEHKEFFGDTYYKPDAYSSRSQM